MENSSRMLLVQTKIKKIGGSEYYQGFLAIHETVFSFEIKFPLFFNYINQFLDPSFFWDLSNITLENSEKERIVLDNEERKLFLLAVGAATVPMAKNKKGYSTSSSKLFINDETIKKLNKPKFDCKIPIKLC